MLVETIMLRSQRSWNNSLWATKTSVLFQEEKHSKEIEEFKTHIKQLLDKREGLSSIKMVEAN
jgi:hypothetical protein